MLRETCRAAGLPLVGVNCLGIVDHVLKAGVTFMPEYPRMTAPPGIILGCWGSGWNGRRRGWWKTHPGLTQRDVWLRAIPRCWNASFGRAWGSANLQQRLA